MKSGKLFLQRIFCDFLPGNIAVITASAYELSIAVENRLTHVSKPVHISTGSNHPKLEILPEPSHFCFLTMGLKR